jgi:aromatic-L-amino-acid decarboxylase
MTTPSVAPPSTGDLSPEVFREYGHQLIDWIAGYLEHPEAYPVMSPVSPGDISAALPPSPPVMGEPVGDMISDFERVILPGITHWNNPAFFAYFATSASVPGILGEILAAGLNANAMLWKASPSATELELVVLDWLRQAIGLGDGWFGVINDTASISSMLALAAARERAGLDVRKRGLAGRDDLAPLRVYCSEHAHSSIDKGALALGLGLENVVKIADDENYRMQPHALAEAIAADRAAGRVPCCVVATVGTTSSCSRVTRYSGTSEKARFNTSGCRR